MKQVVLIAIFALLVVPLRADEDKDATIAELNAKVASLEKRVESLEKLLGPLQTDAQKKALREQFEARMAADRKKYSDEQLREAETLYQIMNKNWRSEEGKVALKTMIEKYPDINRTGCARLYLGQVSQGEDKVQHLQEAIDKHSDCMYGDGVQVGAYARYLLGLHYKTAGEPAKAAALFEEIRKQYPYAVDHSGKSLEARLAN